MNKFTSDSNDQALQLAPKRCLLERQDCLCVVIANDLKCAQMKKKKIEKKVLDCILSCFGYKTNWRNN